jgi:hypothetical protein
MCARCTGEGGELSVEDELHDVIVRVLRKRGLRIFRFVFLGYEDHESTNVYHHIISLLMLTMAPSASDDLECLESAAEKLSLHRVRVARVWFGSTVF